MNVSLESREFTESLSRLEQEITAACGRAALEAGELLAEVWSDLVPRDTGHYASSIHAFLESVSPKGATAIVTSGLGDDYDVYLEFGTHRNIAESRTAREHGESALTPWRMPPHPSLRPAFEASRDFMSDLMVHELDGVLI